MTEKIKTALVQWATNIIKDLNDSIEKWSYKKLNETDRISRYIKEKIKNYEFS